MSHQELVDYIETHAELWAMLSVNIPDVSDRDCKEVAMRVAIELASGSNQRADRGDSSTSSREITHVQFNRFKKEYIDDPKGNLEFFHRTVFQVFDCDNNKVLDSSEIDHFVDLFYDSNSIFAKDARLPEKAVLKALIYSRFDKNKDGAIDFEEIRGVIAGKVAIN
jgi:Ca2+-binding EF-hand superfamily protein